jgi:hypothetical protein
MYFEPYVDREHIAYCLILVNHSHGPALLCNRNIQEPNDDVYIINGDDETGCITFAAGWEHFDEEVGIVEDSVSREISEGMLQLFLILFDILIP